MFKDPPSRTLSELVDNLQAKGRYTLERSEALAALQTSGPTLKKAVMRLAAKRRIAVPKRGFYVMVPIEYRTAGAPPPSWFIDDMMRHLGRSYYVGVLSAAALHGAAHQQPQEFQVVTDEPQRQMQAGRARIRFLVKKKIGRARTSELKTETGTMRVSTPETTAIDLLRYVRAAGGLSNAATVIAELAEKIDGKKLVAAAESDGELAYSQRLGHILDLVGAGNQPGKMVSREKPEERAFETGEAG